MEDDLPDTGDLGADLSDMLRPLVTRLRGPDGKVLVTLAVERVRNPDLAAAFERSVIGAKRNHLRKLVRSAVDRGDLSPDADLDLIAEAGRSEEHTSELQSLMRISYAVFCLKQHNTIQSTYHQTRTHYKPQI